MRFFAVKTDFELEAKIWVKVKIFHFDIFFLKSLSSYQSTQSWQTLFSMKMLKERGDIMEYLLLDDWPTDRSTQKLCVFDSPNFCIILNVSSDVFNML